MLLAGKNNVEYTEVLGFSIYFCKLDNSFQKETDFSENNQ